MMYVAKYKQVHDEILNRLQTGQYAIGMRLPTESELSNAFGVSRVTIRKALEILVRDGYLTSRQGSGYNVATLSPPTSTCLVSFTDKVLREGRVPGARLLRLEVEADTVPPAVKEYFKEPLALVERLRTIDDVPGMLTQTWIPSRLVPHISADHFPETGQSQSILRILQQVFDLAWTSACETLDSLLAEPAIAELLNIPAGTPILSQACTAFDADGAPVFFDQVFRQGPISFDLAGATPRQTA
ncbi:GntR family transcriptional regulator [uncultured Ruegeria sp.]|uniref:GntR family transcriptional regulator n=1 Tax=uncultured Ruegeria sp. TaxID=259304 RepID=UPI002627B1DB|nr:GntR family transcriptional regulator [uncultured Ruegeria sp.]